MKKKNSKEYSRRKFIEASGLAVGALGIGSLGACTDKSQSDGSDISSVNVSKKVYEWRAVTVWPPNFPVLGEAVVSLAKEAEVLSGGRLKIHVYGAGELVPALEVFDAVTLGAVQMGHGVSYYWAGKIPSSVFFGAIPFGMTVQQMNAWLYYGNGLKLWKELYADYGLVPFPCGNTGTQMGGWFNKKVESVADLNGLKMRIPGLGGKVISKAGGAAITMAGGEIYTNLERGVIDATEWIGPFHDYLMGFHKVAKYYYYPGWHEPGAGLELFFNKKALEELPKDLQLMLESLAVKYNQLIFSHFIAKNNFYLQKILTESDVSLEVFPSGVLKQLKLFTKEVIADIVSTDSFSKKVYEDYSKFRSEAVSWYNVSEGAIISHL